ncbi:LysM peptidoglycan-binding domain-containing protein [Frigidibacter sp. MR17.14]|uniref:LysM peptidoglycan-binding domain-containing protein n=1 Tax=Frigidibacter sp. MR17.14 TaxID=3126509 RepID=UPI0030130F36
MPSFDTVRADAQGGVQVAGRAAPGARVRLLADGQEIGSATANARGDFAVLGDVPLDGRPRELALAATDAAGAEIRSQAPVILAPRQAAEAPGAAAPAQALAAAAPGPVATAPATSAEAASAAVTADSAAAPPLAPATATAAAEAPAAPAVLGTGAEGVAVLAGPDSAQVVIDALGYDADGAVSLTGRAGPGEGGAVRLYLDNALAATVALGPDRRWQTRIFDLAPGLYSLRVDQIDAAGKVVSRAETPFQREAPEVLAAAARAAQAPAEPAAPPPAAASTAPAAGPAPATGEAPAAPAATQAPVQAMAGTPANPAAPAETAPVTGGLVQITVQPGYSLWKIAQRNYGDGVEYVRLFEANRDQIRNPDLIYPGQVFTIPAKP